MTAQNLTLFELADFDHLAERLSEHADGIENIAARPMADDMKLAAKLIDTLRRTGLIHSAVALVEGETGCRSLFTSKASELKASVVP
jgi:hypothetical protein